MVTLEELFEDVLAQLPAEPEAKITLNANNCPCPPNEILTRRLRMVARSRSRFYGDSSCHDLVHFFADKLTYRRLGLLLFASVFHPKHQVTLYPGHPESTVTKLRMKCELKDPSSSALRGLANTSAAYGYHAAPVGHIHPLCKDDSRIEGNYGPYANRAAYLLPFLNLTNEDGRCGNPEELAARSVVDGFGGAEATATLGALFLDIGLPQTEVTEFYLESPSGNWSVAIGSAEARLWIGYDYR
jgi:hypothetical protein